MSAAPEAKPPVEVAVGVLLKDDGSFLLGSRPDGKPYAGYWEFPGGKLEAGENVAQALARELDEELGIAIQDALPWVTIEHVYPHAHVRLHFTRVTRWTGELQAREGQRFGWFDLDAHKPEPLLAATVPCIRWLGWPTVMGISRAGELGLDEFLRRFERALARGLRCVQLREPGMDETTFAHLQREVCARAKEAGARVLVNSRHAPRFWEAAGGVHLRAADLATLTARPALEHAGASVHSRAEIERAGELRLDYAVLGPVKPTPTHPGVAGLGWEGYAQLVAAPPLPVYAIGGLRADDLRTAWEHGAHGVALLRAAWE